VTTSAEVKSTATALNATVSDLKVSNEVLKDTVAGGGQAAANKATEEGPSFHPLQGHHHHPGWFPSGRNRFPHSLGTIGCEYAAVQRNSFQRQSAGPCNGVPSLRPPDAGQRPCGDQIANAKVSGYEEADFLTSSVNSNNRQSNSYALRQRQLLGASGPRKRIYVHRRAAVDASHRNEKRATEPHGSVAHDHRRAVYRRLHLGTAVRIPRG